MTGVFWKQTIELDWTPPSLNAFMRMHWRARRRLAEVVSILLFAKVGKSKQSQRHPIRATFQIFRPGRTYDDDNCVVARKLCLDALRKLGWIRNDSKKWVRSEDLPCQIDHARPRTVIVLETEE